MDDFIKNDKNFEELLTYNPFQKNSGFYFVSENIKEIFTILKNILGTKNGCGAVIGKKGTGKTTLINKFINENLKNVDYIYIIGSSASPDELFKEIMEYFADEKINPDIPIKEDTFFKELIKFLKELKEKNQRLFLIFDDAQNFVDETLDVIEKICNLSIGKEKAVTVILLGNEQLEKKLNSKRHKNLRYQLKFFLHIENLKPEEVDRFIKAFLSEKGIEIKVDKNISSLIYKATEGNLEILNRVLNSIVEVIHSNNLKKLDRKTVLPILDNLGLEVQEERKKLPKFSLIGLFILFLIGFYFLLFNKGEEKKTENINEIIAKEKNTPFFPEKKPEPPEVKEEITEKIEKETTENTLPKEEVKLEQEKETEAEIPLTIVNKQEEIKKEEVIKPEQEKVLNETVNKLEDEVNRVSQKIYESYEKGVVLTRTLSLRKGSGTNYKKILDLLKGETVIVIDDKEGKWAKVIYKKDDKEIEGWVYKKFIKKIPKGKAVVTAPFLSVREKPTTKSKRIDKIPKGEVVELTGQKKGIWIKVKYKKDGEIKEGWVSKHFLAY